MDTYSRDCDNTGFTKLYDLFLILNPGNDPTPDDDG
jgi:hypothetical protein